MGMKAGARGLPTRIITFIVCVAIATSACMMLGGCGSGGQGNGSNANDTTRITKTLVKTASNELVLSDLELRASDSPITISSDDAQYVKFIESTEKHSGLDIENLTMVVDVTSKAGAVLGAGGGDSSQNIYTIKSLDATADSHNISYTKEKGFK